MATKPTMTTDEGVAHVTIDFVTYWSRTAEEREEYDEWCRLHDIPIGDRRYITIVPEGPMRVSTGWKDEDIDMKAMPPRWVLGLWR